MKFNLDSVNRYTNEEGVDCVDGYNFILYEYADEVIELEVTRFDIALGISALHYLTREEIVAYTKHGLTALEGRLIDMYDNYSAYRVSSHR